MTVSTISAAGGKTTSWQAWLQPAANSLLRRCAAPAILITLAAVSSLVGACLISVFVHGEKFVGELEDISIALVFAAIAAALKIIEMCLRAKQHASTNLSAQATDQRLTTDHCEL